MPHCVWFPVSGFDWGRSLHVGSMETWMGLEKARGLCNDVEMARQLGPLLVTRGASQW